MAGLLTHLHVMVKPYEILKCADYGMELVEVAPSHDPGYTTALSGLRLIQEALTGLAMRKEGKTESHYLDPRTSGQNPVSGQRTE